MRHFHEKLREVHGIELSYTWVQQALQGAGLVKGASGADHTGGDGSGVPFRACCCTSMAANTAGFSDDRTTIYW